MTRIYSIEELEAYRVFAAFMVLEFGAEYGFVLERIEEMLDRARREDPVAKAKKILADLRAVAPGTSKSSMLKALPRR